MRCIVWVEMYNCLILYTLNTGRCILIKLGVSGLPRNFFSGEGGVKQIQLRTEDRKNGDLGAVAP